LYLFNELTYSLKLATIDDAGKLTIPKQRRPPQLSDGLSILFRLKLQRGYYSSEAQ
jgi:hypothetical protein